MILPKKKYADIMRLKESLPIYDLDDRLKLGKERITEVLDSEGMKQLANEIELVECRLSSISYMEEKLDLRKIVKFLRGD